MLKNGIALLPLQFGLWLISHSLVWCADAGTGGPGSQDNNPPKGVVLGLPFGKTTYYFHGISAVLELKDSQIREVKKLNEDSSKSRLWWEQREINEPRFEKRLASILTTHQIKLRQRIMKETEEAKRAVEKSYTEKRDQKEPHEHGPGQLDTRKMSLIRVELWNRLNKTLTQEQVDLITEAEKEMGKKMIFNAFPKGARL